MREHAANGERCWCAPNVYQVCPECDDDPDEVTRTGTVIAKKDCWRCGGEGLVNRYDDELPNIVVHREESDAA